MKIENIIKYKQPSIYEKLNKPALTRFFEEVEKLLDPASRKLREVL